MKYANQYESSYDPWPRTIVGWAAWLVFAMPGTVILWFGYMFPSRGDGWGSGRRAQNRIVTVMTTLALYVILAVWICQLIAAGQPARP